MERAPFVTIRCPACGSADARPIVGDRFACKHCESSFVYTGERGGRRGATAEIPRSAAVLVAGVAAVMLVFGVAVFVLFFAAADDGSPAAAVTPSAAPAVARPASPPPPPPSPPGSVGTPPRSVAVEPTIEVPPEPPSEPPSEPEPDAPAALSEYQALRGCACPTDAGGANALRVRSTGTTTHITGAGVEVQRFFEFALVTGADAFWPLPTTEHTAPAASYVANQITVGVGCSRDAVVIAAGDRVSAWSRSSRALLWSQSLPEPFGDFGLRLGTEVVLECKSLRPGKDTVAVRSGRRTLRLALADGVIR